MEACSSTDDDRIGRHIASRIRTLKLLLHAHLYPVTTAALSAGVLLPWQAVEGVGMQIRGRIPRNMPPTFCMRRSRPFLMHKAHRRTSKLVTAYPW